VKILLAFMIGLILALAGYSAEIVPEAPPEGWSMMIVIVTPAKQAEGDSFKPSDIMAITVYDGDTVALDDSYFSKQPRIRKDDDILKEKIKSKELAAKLYAEARNLINNNSQLEYDPEFKKKIKDQVERGTISVFVSCAGQEVKITFKLLDMKNIPDNLKKLHALFLNTAGKIRNTEKDADSSEREK
jgi:hypothetical protein